MKCKHHLKTRYGEWVARNNGTCSNL